MSKSRKKSVCGYIGGKRSPLKKVCVYEIRATEDLRAEVNAKLREFLDSDSDHLELMFEGEIVPHSISKAVINIKTCSNNWSQHVIALFEGWPDLISKKLGDYQSHACSEAVVMKNEVLGSNYSYQHEYIPLGYKVVEKEGKR